MNIRPTSQCVILEFEQLDIFCFLLCACHWHNYHNMDHDVDTRQISHGAVETLEAQQQQKNN